MKETVMRSERVKEDVNGQLYKDMSLIQEEYHVREKESDQGMLTAAADVPCLARLATNWTLKFSQIKSGLARYQAV